jgi:NAD(P)-dependent dehydrogenase (short-subunit alcohol dehydrogenase family)
LGPCTLGIACDVSDDEAQRRMLDETLARFGKLDLLVCNAGITGRPGGIESLDLDDYDRVMQVNLRSMVVLARMALPLMARDGGGSVVLVSSIAGIRGNSAISSYALAKAGVAQLARNVAVEWGPRNIRCNAISPGLIATELSAPLRANAQFMERRLQMTPLRRAGTVEEVAGAVVWLASTAGGFVTGQNIVIDGGTVISDGN